MLLDSPTNPSKSNKPLSCFLLQVGERVCKVSYGMRKLCSLISFVQHFVRYLSIEGNSRKAISGPRGGGACRKTRKGMQRRSPREYSLGQPRGFRLHPNFCPPSASYHEASRPGATSLPLARVGDTAVWEFEHGGSMKRNTHKKLNNKTMIIQRT